MVSGTDLVVFLAQKVRALSSLISPHTDRARETLRGGKAAASLAKPLLGKRGEIAPLSAPPHTRLYSKEVIVTYLVIHFMINSPSSWTFTLSSPSAVLGLLRRVVIRLSISSFSFSEQKCSKIENGSC